MRGLKTIVAAMLLANAASSAVADEQPICTDRPSKSTGECTVPPGRVQVETGLIDWSHDRSSGVTSNLTTFGSSLIKYGIGDRTDIELGITPVETLRVRGDGSHEYHSSFGDMVLRLKYRLTRDDAPVQIALDPFVKIPTASHSLGNGKIEGGLLIPLGVPIGKTGLTLSLDPELDLLADTDGRGRHLATQQVINLGLAVSDAVTISTELWTQWDWDPARTTRQVSADAAAAYIIGNNVQLDAGANFGLNGRTADVELYTGVSLRF
jgi:hypothetical protein